MRNISLFRDTAISHSNIDIRIVTKNIAIHRCTGVSLQPYFLALKKGKRFSISACSRKRSFEVMRSKPEETVSLTMRQFLSSLRQDLGQIQPL